MGTILLIDDEPEWVKASLMEIKEKFKERNLEVKDSADSALNYIKSYGDEIDIIILDIMMPLQTIKINHVNDFDTGMYLYNKIKEIKPGIPVIIYTNRNDEEIIQFSQNNNLIYLYKPDTFPFELVNIIKKII